MLRLCRATPATRTPGGRSRSFDSQPNAGDRHFEDQIRPGSSNATKTDSAAPVGHYQALMRVRAFCRSADKA